MPTRRDFLFTGAMLAVPGTPVWGFDADSAAMRYRNWLTQFLYDLARLRKRVIDVAVPEEQIGVICRSTIMPHSRAVVMVSGWLKDAANKCNTSHRARRYTSLDSVVMLLLENSIPAGYGGLFPEEAGNRFPYDRFVVWYMHIVGPNALQAYFDDKTQFLDYKLPPDGVLKRHAYPFLLFEDAKSTLRLAGVGAEWMGAAIYLHRKQYS